MKKIHTLFINLIPLALVSSVLSLMILASSFIQQDKNYESVKISSQYFKKSAIAIIPVPALVPTFSKTDETDEDEEDGSITVTDGTDSYSKLQYKLQGDKVWKDVPASDKIMNLSAGTYQFQWVGKNGEQYDATNSLFKSISQSLEIKIKETSDKKNLIILASTIPVGFISLMIIIWLSRGLYKGKF